MEDSDDYLSNDDGVYDDLHQLDDKVIRKTNRLVTPKEKKKIKKQLKAVRARRERDEAREEALLVK